MSMNTFTCKICYAIIYLVLSPFCLHSSLMQFMHFILFITYTIHAFYFFSPITSFHLFKTLHYSQFHVFSLHLLCPLLISSQYFKNITSFSYYHLSGRGGKPSGTKGRDGFPLDPITLCSSSLLGQSGPILLPQQAKISLSLELGTNTVIVGLKELAGGNSRYSILQETNPRHSDLLSRMLQIQMQQVLQAQYLHAKPTRGSLNALNSKYSRSAPGLHLCHSSFPIQLLVILKRQYEIQVALGCLFRYKLCFFQPLLLFFLLIHCMLSLHVFFMHA